MKISAKSVGFTLSGALHLGVLAAVLLVNPPVSPAMPTEVRFELDLASFEAPVMSAAAVPSSSEPALQDTATTEPEAFPENPVEEQPVEAQAMPLAGSKATPAVMPVPQTPARAKSKPQPPQQPEPSAKQPVAVAREAAGKTEVTTTQVAQPSSVPVTASARPATVARSDSQLKHAFLTALAERINQYKFYPKASRRRAEHGTVVVAFTLERSGQVRDPRIESSSGSRRLDRAALAILSKANPFQPIPEALNLEQWSLSVPIAYSLQ